MLVATALVVGLVVLAPVAPAQDESPSTTRTTLPESGGIIPEPNTGVEPSDAGDRGGALQTALFVLIVAGVGVIGFLVLRESRRKRAERGY